MSLETRTETVRALEWASRELQEVSRTTEREIDCVARMFQALAGQMDTILNITAEVITCIDNERIGSVLPQVQNLGVAAKRLMDNRLHATNGTLDLATTEIKLLRRLSQVTRGQAGIALETKALSVLTNIEVAHLGAVGAGFQYLARELAEFSKSMTADIQELAGLADGRRAAIEATRGLLAIELPRWREELAGIEKNFDFALSLVASNLTELSRLPAQFRASVQDVAQQIAGVVAAVQAHDITRQQIEHVQTGFKLIAERVAGSEGSAPPTLAQLAEGYAGLTIQIYQLQNIRKTISNWASQIRVCTDGILQVSTSEVLGIGSRVLDQERELSSQFASIERLESESQTYSAGIQRTFGGLANLSQLVNQHLQRSRSVRHHLELLTFNSIIEANGLGVQAAAILAIAQCIKGISAEWSRMTDQSGQAMQEVLALEKQTDGAMQAFSASSNENLRAAQEQTTSGLATLRSAAAFAAGRAQDMQTATEKLQANSADVTRSVELLDDCFGRLATVLSDLEGVRDRWEIAEPQVKDGYEAAEVERLFSESYTTEMERTVLRAALQGTAPPVAEQSFAGNDVELF